MKRKAFSFERKLFRQDIYEQEIRLLLYRDFQSFSESYLIFIAV